MGVGVSRGGDVWSEHSVEYTVESNGFRTEGMKSKVVITTFRILRKVWVNATRAQPILQTKNKISLLYNNIVHESTHNTENRGLIKIQFHSRTECLLKK